MRTKTNKLLEKVNKNIHALADFTSQSVRAVFMYVQSEKGKKNVTFTIIPLYNFSFLWYIKN